MHKISRHAVAISTLILVAPAAYSQAVHVVDEAGGPGSTFTEISSAVAAAAPGDMILVREGTYDPFSVTQSLSIQAEPGATVTIADDVNGLGTISVTGLAVTDRFTLRGIDVPAGSTGGLVTPALVITNCRGPVLVEDCFFKSVFVGHPAGGAGEGVKVTRSTSAAFVRCTIEGFPGAGPASVSDALGVCGSSVQLFDCNVRGASAVTVVGGQLFAAGGTLTGDFAYAVRLTSNIFLCPGNGISEARLVDVGLVSASGFSDISDIDGTFVLPPGTARKYAVDSPLREGESGFDTYTGESGDFAIQIVSGGLVRGVAFPEFNGFAYLATPVVRVQRGFLPASGVLTQPILGPDLGPGGSGVVFFIQAAFAIPSEMTIALTNPAGLQIVDASF